MGGDLLGVDLTGVVFLRSGSDLLPTECESIESLLGSIRRKTLPLRELTRIPAPITKDSWIDQNLRGFSLRGFQDVDCWCGPDDSDPVLGC